MYKSFFHFDWYSQIYFKEDKKKCKMFLSEAFFLEANFLTISQLFKANRIS